MNRRKFLRIFGLSPLVLAIPSIMLAQKAMAMSIAKQIGVPWLRPLKSKVSVDGGYFMSNQLAIQMHSDFHTTIVAKQFKIPMIKKVK